MSDLLSDPKFRRADLALVRRAIQARWNIPEHLRSLVPEAMAEILASPASEARDRIGAAKVVVAMEGQNQTDDLATDKNERLDNGQATERVTVVRIEGYTDDLAM